VPISLPDLIKEVNHHLDIAENEFFDGVFAPFWDQIENATNKLASYHYKINILDHIANDYNDLASRPFLVTENVPSFSLSNNRLPDAKPTTKRLAKLVRQAQKDFHFATIYEQRKTNQLLYEGFQSLGEAIYSMEYQITSSIQNLSNRIQISLDDLIDSSREQTQVLSRHNEDMKQRFDDLKDLAYEESSARRKFEQESLSQNSKESSTRKEFEEKSLKNQKEQNEMLNNIQRRRKPPRWGS
jgi:hypothetical protein